MNTLISPIYQTLERGQSVVLATILSRTGSAPRGVGAAMLVYQDGRTLGTVGGGAVEHRVWQKAMDCFFLRRSTLDDYCLAPNEAVDLGMVCGGDISVLCWYLSPENTQVRTVFAALASLSSAQQDVWLVRQIAEDGAVCDVGVVSDAVLSHAQTITLPSLRPLLKRRALFSDDRLFVEPVFRVGHAWVFGGGHIAQELVPLLFRLDFSPVVFDDRAEFATASLFPSADQVILGDFTQISQSLTIRPADYVVIMTRGHRYDHELLTQVLRTDAAYIGLIGSRSKIAHTKSLLLQEGFSDTDFERVHTPVGLSIGAETPAEIAVSIAAEMIFERSALSATEKRG